MGGGCSGYYRSGVSPIGGLVAPCRRGYQPCPIEVLLRPAIPQKRKSLSSLVLIVFLKEIKPFLRSRMCAVH